MLEKSGGISLTIKDLQQITGGRELTDKHVNAYQNIMKHHFPHLGGFQSTLLQMESPLAQDNHTSLQTIRKSHWSCLQISGTNIHLYDSTYSTRSADTLEIIAQLVQTINHSIEVQMMNVAKQSCSTDSALFAMATMTHLALDIDPLKLTYDQEQLRPHLVNIWKRNNHPLPYITTLEASNLCQQSRSLLHFLSL